MLQLAVEVDHHIAARDQIEFGKRRVLDEAVHREHAQVADLLDRAIFIAVLGEPALEALGTKGPGGSFSKRPARATAMASASMSVPKITTLGGVVFRSFASRIMMAME